MAALNIDNTIIIAMWTLLEASASFTSSIKPGNRLKRYLEQAQGVKYAPTNKPIKQVADLAEVDIDLAHFNMTHPMNTFGMCRTVEQHQQQYKITIITDQLSVKTAAQVKWEIVEAFRAGKNTLGVAPTQALSVADWEIPSATMNDRRDEANIMRRHFDIYVRVRYRCQF